MSGGSMNYISSRLENDAKFEASTPLRLAFRKHIAKVAKALHDIEWVDSGDYSPGDEEAAIRECVAPELLLESAIDEVHKAIAAFNNQMKFR